MQPVCPQCREALTPRERDTQCARGHAYPVRDGLPVLLVPSEGWDASGVAAEFEAKYKNEAEPWQYSRRGAELLKYRFIEAQATRLLGDLPGKRVADIGCSIGGLTAALGGKGADVFALDLSPTAVARARARFPAASFAIASSTRVPLPLASVDLAVLSDGLRSWQLTPPQIDACLTATKQILKPNAPALFLDYMKPKHFNAFVQMIDGQHMMVEDVFMLADRLYYTIERVAKDLHLPIKGLLANEGFAKVLRGLSSVGGRAGSKHICVIARAR